MPEMPEVEGLVSYLASNLIGRTVSSAQLAAFSALKTFEVPLSALQVFDITAVQRRGKFLAVGVDGLWLAFHLAGWLTWHDPVPATPVRPSKVAAGAADRRRGRPGQPGRREHRRAGWLLLTEAGTQKHLAIYVVTDLAQVPGIARLGPDPLAEGFDLAAFSGVLAQHGRTQLKGLLKDQPGVRRHRQRLLRRDPAGGAAQPVQAGRLAHRRRGRGAVRGRPGRPDRCDRPRRGRQARPAQGWQAHPPARPRQGRTALPDLRHHHRRGELRRLVPQLLAPAARPAASCWPIGGCPSCSSEPDATRAAQ